MAFKTFSIRPTTGTFDSLSSPDEVGWTNWRVVKNAVTRATRNRQRSGGWRRLFAEDSIYNNQDLHDQLTDRLFYYDAYSALADFGGDLIGYTYAYQAPPYTLGGEAFFPPATQLYHPVYLGDYEPTLVYNGCKIFYPFVGYPYFYYPGFVQSSSVLAHWPMQDRSSGFIEDVCANYDLSVFGTSNTTGVIGGGQLFVASEDDYLTSSNAAFQTGDIVFGQTGWITPSSTGSEQHVWGRWSSAGNRSYRLIITSGGQFRFDVSNDGTAIVSVTHPTVLAAGTRYFVACWHDSALNTINIRIGGSTTASTSHSTGVLAGGGALYFSIGYDEASASSTLDAIIDEVTFWKNGFPSTASLDALYNSGAGIAYPFNRTSQPNVGAPAYYLSSYIYTSCEREHPTFLYSGYPYGASTAQYSPLISYEYDYCGGTRRALPGCREPITMLNEIVTAEGRKLIAGTQSRVYELNQSSGSWRILHDGIGNSGYTVAQCTCGDVRGMSAALGGYMLFTNGFDAPSYYFVGDTPSGCDLQAFQTLTDLVALGITRAGGVIVWKGFVIFFDITENGERKGGTVIWSDLESPDSFIESDTSFAGSATIAVGETILAAAPMHNWLMLYTDKSIIRVTLVGGDDVFNFETIYRGGNALKYKYSLVNAGDQHLYIGQSDVFVLTQYDSRPINVPWITKAAGFMFNGISEDNAAYDPINTEACNMVTGGWNESTREALFSWPTGENTCPNVTLRLNLKFNAADFIDHGFTAFLTFYRDGRPTFGQWLEDLGVCSRGSLVGRGIKEGQACADAGAAVSNPPLYIWNETEDPSLPNHPQSLCALLSGKTEADYCEDCLTDPTFIAASAEDYALKQFEDDIGYREMIGGSLSAYDGYACHGQTYVHRGYETVMQTGAESFRTDDEKMLKMVSLEADPEDQSTPSIVTMEVGYAAQPGCFTWKATKDEDYECLTSRTAAQHATARTRPDGTFYFPTWTRGRFLATRMILDGVGGLGKFSAFSFLVKNWGQQDSP